MSSDTSASDTGIVRHDKVIDKMQAILRAANLKWTDDELELISGVKARAIRSYRTEGKEPSISAAMSLCVAIGPSAINTMLSIIGYVAQPVDQAEASGPAMAAAEAMCELGRFAKAAADNRIDHVEEPESTDAADNVIELLVPYSSKARVR